MSRATRTCAVAAMATIGSYQATKFFVPMAGNPQSQSLEQSLRGAAIAKGAVPSPAGVAPAATGALIAAGALALAVSTARAHRRPTAAVARCAEAAEAAAAPETAEEATPPPPPPFDPAKQLGTTAPLGYFDPLNFCKKGDEEGFRKLRVAEMKHGRVAMMAAVGAVVQHYVQFPGFGAVPKGIGAVSSPPGTYGFVALFVVSGLLEVVLWTEDSSKPVDSVGDYGNPLQLGIGQPLGESVDMRNRELNNGRAAMFAALGIIVAELVSGKDAMQQLGFS